MSLRRVSYMLLLVFLFGVPRSSTLTGRTRCRTFMQNFPLRLKQLRTSFSTMREYYEEQDRVETALLNSSVLTEIKSTFGCHAMSNILRFYLDTVLPAAHKSRKEFKNPIGTIGEIFFELKRELIYCNDYFSCKKPFQLNTIIDTYNEMQDKGLYKAMRELDSLFNYIEEYMASRRHDSTMNL